MSILEFIGYMFLIIGYIGVYYQKKIMLNNNIKHIYEEEYLQACLIYIYISFYIFKLGNIL